MTSGACQRPKVAFGPEMPDNGSWAWLGIELAGEVCLEFDTSTWRTPTSDCDLLVVVKQPLSNEFVRAMPPRLPLIYFPVDFFQCEEHISAEATFLTRCTRIVTTSRSLLAYFSGFAPTVALEHHVRFARPRMAKPVRNGSILWTGLLDNLVPLVQWVNENGLPDRLKVLTNLRDESVPADELGFNDPTVVQVEKWTPQRHYDSLLEARAAIDLKGNEFPQKHKPPTKGVDLLAAGLPLAMNPDCAAAEYFQSMGFEVASPADVKRWYSDHYELECLRIGGILREHLNIHRVGQRFRGIIREVLAEQPHQPIDSARSGHLAKRDAITPAGVHAQPSRSRVAVASFLFNWPSTGGGIVHTLELAKFLQQDGFEVLHIYASNPNWHVGNVKEALPYPSKALKFDSADVPLQTILDAYRNAIRQFRADHVIITDSWNIKPWIARAVGEVPYILRFQALECLCPLNNVRLLPRGSGEFSQCGKHQLATPQGCHSCISQHGGHSGWLHQWERSICGVGTAEYDAVLRTAIADANAVLVVNQDMATMFSPYSDRVHVVPSGFDPSRFPTVAERRRPGPYRILFAGLAEEWMKGLVYLRQACALLWNRRQDFELLVTDRPTGDCEPFVRFIGWQSQSDLAQRMQDCDLLAVPTIAQEALGRTAVEAMAAGRPVVASRIGGLKSTVLEGCTGLLAEPGNPVDLAAQIERLLDDAPLREQLGHAGRRRFEECFSWNVIIPRFYRPLLEVRPAHSHNHPNPN